MSDLPSADTGLFANVGPAVVPTIDVIKSMLSTGKGISDLVFSPGRPPQVEKHGELVAASVPGLAILRPHDTARVAADLIGSNAQALRTLIEQGSCDLSFSAPEVSRFRVNVFRQRGSYAVVMRLIASTVPTMADLGLPAVINDVAALKNGVVLVTGPTGSGKSSTLAALIDQINQTRAEHILTVEDPIEFLHTHKRGTVHQREVHSDTPTFAAALRAALRQAPKVILVGEMRDRETIEIALKAAETGHLVLSTLHTIDASSTVDRIIGSFDSGDQRTIRSRFAASFRYVISQRLVPKKEGGRIAVLEILKATARTRDYIERGESEGRSLLDAMRDGGIDGMQYFDGELENLVRHDVITQKTAYLFATNAGNLRLALADVPDEEESGVVVITR